MPKQCRRWLDVSTGFTALEILSVLIILGILAAIAIPKYLDVSSQASILTAADKELAKLDWQQMAYTAPDRMEMGSISTVNVALGGNRTFTELVSLLENAGRAEGQHVQVAERMEARLTGSAFEIIPTTPETQLVSKIQATKWQWQVKAKELGKRKLYLSLNALLAVNGKDTTKSISTFQREISIQVTSFTGAWAFMERYWAYLTVALTAIIIPLFIHLWNRHNRADGAKPLEKPNKSVQRTPPRRRR